MTVQRVLTVTTLVAAVVCAAYYTLSAQSVPFDNIRFSHWSAEPLGFLQTPPYYLSREVLGALPVLPPPANSSPLTRAELDELLRLQSTRTATERTAIMQHLEYAQLTALFVRAAGRDLATLPHTQALLDHVNLDGRWAVFHVKQHFARPRPNRLEPRLQPCIPVPGHPAYPSAHAIQGYLLGRVVALLAPEASDTLSALGLQVAHEREIAGVHYASDGAAGRALGESVFTLLQSNTVFQREVNDARAEWTRAH